MDESTQQSLTARPQRQPKCAYCDACFAADDAEHIGLPRQLMKCAGCLMTYYCCKDHQRVDWKRHKEFCKSVQAKLTAMAAAEAEAHLTHGTPIVSTQTTRGAGLVPGRRSGSNTQLCTEQASHRALFGNISLESSRHSSETGSPNTDIVGDGGSSAGSSVYGSMADLISSTPYYTSKGGKYSVVQTVGNPKRARFPLTVIRERRSSIGAGEAARLAQAAAAAKVAGKSPPKSDSASDDESGTETDSTPATVRAIGTRKRPAAMNRAHQLKGSSRDHPAADRCASDVDLTLSTRLQMTMDQKVHREQRPDEYGAKDPSLNLAARMQSLDGKKDHRKNPVLDLATDPRFQFDAMVPRHAAFNLRVRRLALCVAASLREYGWCVVNHFMGEIHARAIYHETVSLYMTPGLFADGQLMKAPPPEVASQMPQLQSPKDVRSDQICWFDNRVDRGVHISFLVSMVDSIMHHLTEHIPPYRVNGRSRAMIACYPGQGTKYVRHVDNPDRDGRCVTTIYYLNESWNREHGGILRLYPESSLGPVDVQPLFDRLLFFWSDRRNPHEVLPSYQKRFAITIWYFDATERAEALSREQQQHHAEKKSHQAASAATEQQRSPTSVEMRSDSTESAQSPGVSESVKAMASRWNPGNRSSTRSTYSARTQHSQREATSLQMELSNPGTAPPPASPADTASVPSTSKTVGGRMIGSSYVDYTKFLPMEVVNKLLSTSISANPNQRGDLVPVTSAAASVQRVKSPSSPQVDPVGYDS